MRELRFIPRLEIRSAAEGSDSAGVVFGTVVNYGEESEPIQNAFREVILPGAFSEHLATGPDVLALFEHREQAILGRSKAQTLRITDTPQALAFELELPNTAAGRDIATQVRRKDIAGMSFGFLPDQQRWRENRSADGFPVREVLKGRIYEVSFAVLPFYQGSEVQMRSAAVADIIDPARILETYPHNRKVPDYESRQKWLEALAQSL